MNIDELRESIKLELAKEKTAGKDSTIPNLCEKFDELDDFVMASVVAELESSGDAELVGFKTVYREDGGAIHLARYTGRA